MEDVAEIFVLFTLVCLSSFSFSLNMFDTVQTANILKFSSTHYESPVFSCLSWILWFYLSCFVLSVGDPFLSFFPWHLGIETRLPFVGFYHLNNWTLLCILSPAVGSCLSPKTVMVWLYLVQMWWSSHSLTHLVPSCHQLGLISREQQLLTVTKNVTWLNLPRLDGYLATCPQWTNNALKPQLL